ncbi:MAG: group 1 truncated hemoglobin [Burkholderiales bacterium]|nr:group 1 truncated hemoglobin [Burkholderiales bacterium]
MPDDQMLAPYGGYDGLSRITATFVERVQKHPRIGRFFQDADGERLSAMLSDQFCDLLGAGCKYSGKKMLDVHRGLSIGTADFNALVEALQEALDAAGVPVAQQNRLLARLAPMHRDVVQR